MAPENSSKHQNPAHGRSERFFQLIAFGAALFTLLSRLFLIFSTRATEEDFYITLRYAENIARGHGFVYNLGERVLGATTPLYTLLLALFVRLHLDPVLGGKLVCTASEALICIILWRLGRAIGRPLCGTAAAVCAACAPLNLIESVKGMEVSIVACAAAACWMFWYEQRQISAWICASMVLLLRIDGALLCAVLFAADRLRYRRSHWSGPLFCAAIAAPWFAFALFYFGTPVPQSLRAKAAVYAWHSRGLLPNAAPFLSTMTHNPMSAAIFVGAILCAAALIFTRLRKLTAARIAGPRSHVPAVGAMILWLALYYSGMAFSRVFLFGWYYLPPAPTLYFCAAVGWEFIGRRFMAARRSRRPSDSAAPPLSRTEAENLFARFGMVITAAGLLIGIVAVRQSVKTLTDSQRAETGLRIPIGEYLRDRGRPSETVMLEPIGYIGYISGMRVLDTVGLVSPEVVSYYALDRKSPYHDLWRRFTPDWILLRGGEKDALYRYEMGLANSDRLESAYRLDRTWRNIDMPGANPAFYLYERRASH